MYMYIITQHSPPSTTMTNNINKMLTKFMKGLLKCPHRIGSQSVFIREINDTYSVSNRPKNTIKHK